MGRTTIDYGIDLGVRQSCIAVLEGTQARIIKNDLDMDFTPSAVWINKRGELSVGQRAKQRLVAEPEDAYAEFKLQMGSSTEYRFSHSGRTMRPEELSAEVLKSLKADVKRAMGEDLLAAVITVPAAFELPQCEATQKAAQLAGLKLSPLIMEPTAAAMAHAFQSKADGVFWLVYDFGGGTFDAAVIRIKEGTFQLVNHAGDNELGGKLLDWDIVNKILAPAVAKDHKLTDFRLGHPRWHLAFAKLKWAAEEAKIGLSQKPSYEILIDFLCNDDNGQPIAFEYDLRREGVTALAAPYIRRSVNIARKALADAHLGTADIEKVILVGGPTKAPYVRELLSDPADGLGIALDFSLDPMTVVAQGAAIFAGTQRLPAGLTGQVAQAGVFEVKLEYDPMGADPEPNIGGKVVPPAGQDVRGFTIEFENLDSKPAWRSGRVALNGQGAFLTKLWAMREKTNTYRIEVCDGDGNVRPCAPDTLTYTVGLVPTAPPLIHSVGIALPDGRTRFFLDKGVALPARKLVLLRTARTLKCGRRDDSVVFPVVEGENARADRNTLIGRLEIPAKDWPRDLPMGSEVEVTIEIDASRLVRTSAYIPLLDMEFEQVLKLEEGTRAPEDIERDLQVQKERLAVLRQKARAAGDSNAQRAIKQGVDEENVLANLEEALAAAEEGDPNAVGRAGRHLGDLKATLDKVEAMQEWPTAVKEAEEEIERSTAIARDTGDANTKQDVEQLCRETREAISSQDVGQLERKVEELRRRKYQVAHRTPDLKKKRPAAPRRRAGVRRGAREVQGSIGRQRSLDDELAAIEWREAVDQAEEQISTCSALLEEAGDPRTRNRLNELSREINAAIADRDSEYFAECFSELDAVLLKLLVRRRTRSDQARPTHDESDGVH